MANLTIRTNKATATTFFAGKMRASAIALCAKYDGTAEIVDTKDGKRYRFAFKDNTCARKFAADFEKAYTEATASKPAPTHTPAPAPKKPSKKAAPSPTEKKSPKKGKGKAVDFSKFTGTKSEKNKALHKYLVGMGIADSRTPEYTSVWNARPWAK
jgi:hypothetical protein